ncbi:MAG: hypothetical protein ACR2PK_09120 [Acidimicrobiales bacterium]
MAEPPVLTNADATSWFGEQVPTDWFSQLRALVDRDEIMVVGTLGDSSSPESNQGSAGEDGSAERVELDAIERFREETRETRVGIASRAQAKFGRKVSWATACGQTQLAFTQLSVPVMTRLRIPERQILDTLVGAGVARSRSDALGWCVRLVAEHEGEWLSELQEAIDAVDEIRAQGPA